MKVAPLVGAWIEIIPYASEDILNSVAPLVGAWIEIHITPTLELPRISSLPLWERGLKSAGRAYQDIIMSSLPSWERELK